MWGGARERPGLDSWKHSIVGVLQNKSLAQANRGVCYEVAACQLGTLPGLLHKPSLSWGVRAAQGCSPLHCIGGNGSCEFITTGLNTWDRVSSSPPEHTVLSQPQPGAAPSEQQHAATATPQACHTIKACTGPPQVPHETTAELMRDGVQDDLSLHHTLI